MKGQIAQIYKPVGVIGAGSFGTAIAQLLSINTDVLVYSRNEATVAAINLQHECMGIKMPQNVRATSSPEELALTCTLIFPIVTSESFRAVMRLFGPFIKPSHIIIHGTKGFDLVGVDANHLPNTINRQQVRTMSEVILEETSAVRVGCLSGPNLAREIFEGQPTATLISSRYSEVIKEGKKVLNSKKFHVFGSHEILGAELAGALKNVIALGSGILAGRGMGKNIQAMLVTRGLSEMIAFGRAFGTNTQAFLGTAGIGDLVATATSENSRNFTVGMRLAKGESVAQITASMSEVAEGIRTVNIAMRLAKAYKLPVPIMSVIYRVVFEGFDVERAVEFLMQYSYEIDVDFA